MRPMRSIPSPPSGAERSGEVEAITATAALFGA